MTPDLERAEVGGVVDFARAAPPELAAREGIAVLDLGPARGIAVASLPGNRMLNHAFGVSAADELDEIERFYAGRSPEYSVSPAPGADLDAELERRGFTPGYPWMKFRRSPEPHAAATDLTVRQIGPEHGEAFGAIVTAAFELPRFLSEWLAVLPGRESWACYLSFDGDEPAGAGAIHVAGDSAWFTWGATLPAYRGRGSQGALFAERIEEARRRGCATLVTETGGPVDGQVGPSYRNILRSGFEEAYLRANWSSPRAAPAAGDLG